MISRAKSGIYSYIFLISLTALVTFIWYDDSQSKGPEVIVSSSFLEKANIVHLAKGSDKAVIIMKKSPQWTGGNNAVEKKIEAGSGPSFRGIVRTPDSIGFNGAPKGLSPVEQVVLILTEKPFLREVDKPELNKGQDENFHVIFFNENNMLIEFVVGPLSFSGGEVYVKNIATGRTCLVGRELYFLVKDLHSGG